MRRLSQLGATILGLLALAPPASAFCGFYVTKADTQLFNRASQVVLVRDGDRTVMTMANDFRGDPSEFAMVIPVPTVLEREQIHVGDKQLIDHLDAYSAPRLVEYFDENPCSVVLRESLDTSVAMAAPSERAEARNRALGVVIEASYTVGEYDILILSAQQSDGLGTWLTENGYRIPAGAAATLGVLHPAEHAVLRGSGQPRGTVGARLLVSPATPDRLRIAKVHAANPPWDGQRRRPAGPLRVCSHPTRSCRDDQLPHGETAQRCRGAAVPEGQRGIRRLLSGDVRQKRRAREPSGRVPGVRVGIWPGAIPARRLHQPTMRCDSSVSSGSNRGTGRAGSAQPTSFSHVCMCDTTANTSRTI